MPPDFKLPENRLNFIPLRLHLALGSRPKFLRKRLVLGDKQINLLHSDLGWSGSGAAILPLDKVTLIQQ